MVLEKLKESPVRKIYSHFIAQCFAWEVTLLTTVHYITTSPINNFYVHHALHTQNLLVKSNLTALILTSPILGVIQI